MKLVGRVARNTYAFPTREPDFRSPIGAALGKKWRGEGGGEAHNLKFTDAKCSKDESATQRCVLLPASGAFHHSVDQNGFTRFTLALLINLVCDVSIAATAIDTLFIL